MQDTLPADATKFRIGIGHDTHRLVEGGPLIVGGVVIQFDKQLEGHSDADVLLHAVTDAILGAACLGDIGDLYPDDAEENKGRNSAEMLSNVCDRVRELGFQIINVDCILFAERPKFARYKRDIAFRISEILSINEYCVGVKAKTGEGMGPVGSGDAMCAQCVALLYRRK